MIEIINAFLLTENPLFLENYHRYRKIVVELIERVLNYTDNVKFLWSSDQTPIFGEFLKISQNLQKPKIANYRENIDFLYSTWI